MAEPIALAPVRAAALLNTWETGRALSPAQRGLLLLLLGWPQQDAQALAALPLSARNQHVLALRRVLFGPRIEATARCPACDGRVEMEFTVADLAASGSATHTHTHRDGRHVLTLQPLNTLGLIASADAADAAGARVALLTQCITQARHGRRAVAVADLPDEVLARAAAALDALDPDAEMWLSLKCPLCAHAWRALFDVVGFVWRELDGQARTLLDEVHALATAYGWSEADILTMSAWRRRQYLERMSP